MELKIIHFYPDLMSLYGSYANVSVLRRYLEADEANPNSENDFGKNVIPAMLGDGERIDAYRFSG